MASNDEDAMFMQTMVDSSLRPLWRLTYVPFKMRGDLSQQKNVKNEGTYGDVHENKWTEKMKNDSSGDVDENTQVTRKLGRGRDIIERKGLNAPFHQCDITSCVFQGDFFTSDAGRLLKKMLKMKVDPTICMKTKGRVTQWPITNRASCPKYGPPFYFSSSAMLSEGIWNDVERRTVRVKVRGLSPG